MVSDLSAGTADAPHIPVLRFGEEYTSLDVNEVTRVNSDEVVVRVSMANPGLVKRDLLKLAEARKVLRRVPAADLVAMAKQAGEYFFHEDLPLGDTTQSPEDYLNQLHATSGLPHSLIRMNMNKLYQLSPDLTLTESAVMGPKEDSPLCSVQPDCPQAGQVPVEQPQALDLLEFNSRHGRLRGSLLGLSPREQRVEARHGGRSLGRRQETQGSRDQRRQPVQL